MVAIDITPTGDEDPIHREFEIDSVASDHQGKWVFLDEDGFPRAFLDDEDMSSIVGEMFDEEDLFRGGNGPLRFSE